MTVSCFVTSQFTNKNVQLVEIATYGIEENPVLSSTYLSCTIHSTLGKLKACVQSPETVHLIFSVHLTLLEHAIVRGFLSLRLSFCHIPVFCLDETTYDRAVFSIW